MVVTPDELRFDFGGARLDPVRDRRLLVWTMNQFLYGEVTGVQVGHWLYRAPHLEAAHFLARQALEELQHVDRFATILARLDAAPEPAHALVRFLSSGMMGEDWAEHVCIEMALGEGLVLAVLYALVDTVDDEAIEKILRGVARQEERHVAFGEAETRRVLAERPSVRSRLLGLALVSLAAVSALGRAARRRAPASHPVLRRLPAFATHVRRTGELRLERLGVAAAPIARLGPRRRLWLVLRASAGHAARRLSPFRPARLTRRYLDDPHLAALVRRAGRGEGVVLSSRR